MDKLYYLLLLLAEESAELIKTTTKAKRFGMEGCDPDTNIPNKEEIVREAEDIIAVFELLVEEGQIRELDKQRIKEKKERIELSLQVTESLGLMK